MPRPSSALSAVLARAFVGRRAELDLFEGLLWPAAPTRYQVLSLRGVGGQGKTTLLDQFAQRLQALDCRDRPVARLDCGLPEHRSMVDGLFSLRNALRQQGVATHAFDVAFARHFALTRPGRDIKRDYPELYRFPEDSLFGELVDIGAEAVREIPGGKLAVGLLARLSNRLEQWYTTRGLPILAQLDGLSMQQLGQELPLFLGFDLLEFVTAHPRRRPVIIVDTYEALWRDSGSATPVASASGDRWLRRLAEECPGCLWVVAGRHRVGWAQHDPDWAQYIVDRELGALSPDDADALLDAGGITGDALRGALRDVAAGHPLSLALGIRYCQMRADGGAPVNVHDLPRTQQEVLDRFFDHLDATARGLVRVLAVPSRVHTGLWPHLARSAFPIFDLYPASALLQEVFFRPVSEHEFAMHERVREHLLADLAHRDPDLLQRARLAVFDFYDLAAAGHHEGPASTVRRRDACLLEAAQQLVDAAPERYIAWCAMRLNEGHKGSRQRPALIARADPLIAAIDPRKLRDAVLLAELRVSGDPWDPQALALVDRLSEAIDGAALDPQVVGPLHRIAGHLLAAQPSRLPRALVQALLRSGVEDIGLALAAGELERALPWAEAAVRQSGALNEAPWFCLVVIARADRADLCECIGDRLAAQKRDRTFWAVLAQCVDGLDFEDAPRLAVRLAQRALRVTDVGDLVAPLAALAPCVITHQVVLTLVEALVRSGEPASARSLVEQRFGTEARAAFVAGLQPLLSAGGGPEVLATESGRQFVEAFEQAHRVHGFLQGYLDAALATDPGFAPGLPASVLEAIRAEITRSRAISSARGGRPNMATLFKLRFELVRNDQGEVMLFHNDALLLSRPVDWLAFDADWTFRFGDVRRGQGYRMGLLVKPGVELDVGDGARWLVVMVDEDGEPVWGDYKSFYGRAW